MKYLIPFLFLTGCAGSLTNDSVAPTTSPNPTASGKTSEISWECEQEIVNEQVVWVKCDFINKSEKQAKVAIQVTYNLNTNNSSIATSRILYSGWLLPNEASKNYAAFIGKNKENLVIACDKDLARCHLSSHVVN